MASRGRNLHLFLGQMFPLFKGKTAYQNLAANLPVDMVFSQENYQSDQCIVVSSSGLKEQQRGESGEQEQESKDRMDETWQTSAL